MVTVDEQIACNRQLAEMLLNEEEADVVVSEVHVPKIKSLNEALQHLSLQSQPDCEHEINLLVQRHHVLRNALEGVKESKLTTSRVSVEFLGEPAVDTGGPTKEMFSLAFQQAVNCKFIRGHRLT